MPIRIRKATRSARHDLWRWNGISNTAAKIRAKISANGTPIPSVARNVGTPGETLVATKIDVAIIIGACTR